MNRVEFFDVDLGGLSHQGLVRQNNEDHYLVASVERSIRILQTNLPADQVPGHHLLRGYAFVVADGVGGAKGGEVASASAIRELVDLARETPDWIMIPEDEEASSEVLRRFLSRFRKISRMLHGQAQANPGLSGMATTMTACVTIGNGLLVAHVGDSRAYLQRDGVLHQLTKDDTLTQALLDSGAIAPEHVRKHPYRHVLTQSLGSRPTVEDVELHWLDVAPGDCLLLCSDGLTDMVPGEAISEVLERGRTAAETCSDLVEMALAAGGKDNVTAVVARYAAAP